MPDIEQDAASMESTADIVEKLPFENSAVIADWLRNAADEWRKFTRESDDGD